MRVRVREAMSQEEFDELYLQVANKPDHAFARIEQAVTERDWIETHEETRTFQKTLIGFGYGIGKVTSIADMSCGTGDIARALGEYSGVEPMLGEYGPGYPYQGTLQETVPQIGKVDLFILTETMEHLDNPEADLALIRQHTKNILVSTPLDEGELIMNGQFVQPATGHYWRWSREDVEAILTGAGFEVQAHAMLDMTPKMWQHCRFGFWNCR